ncbi:MAG: HNH endonuclease signature motif containing protein [Planctomycetota bacterium]|nr:HNH endonuclease signature motif containing protein [Planctomycetota bacterium]
MRQDQREALRYRFGFRCGYCGVAECDVGAELTVDHFQPRSRGGLDEPDNWVYCCHPCNEFKGDCWQPDSSDRRGTRLDPRSASPADRCRPPRHAPDLVLMPFERAEQFHARRQRRRSDLAAWPNIPHGWFLVRHSRTIPSIRARIASKCVPCPETHSLAIRDCILATPTQKVTPSNYTARGWR